MKYEYDAAGTLTIAKIGGYVSGGFSGSSISFDQLRIATVVFT